MPEDKLKRNKRQQKWLTEKKDRVNMAFTKGIKEKLQEAADAAGLSKTQYAEIAILEKIERDKNN